MATLVWSPTNPPDDIPGELLSLVGEDGLAHPGILVDAAGLTGGNADFVLRPADPAGAHDNVYLAWGGAGGLSAALNARQGPKRVEVDTTFAPAHMTAGALAHLDQLTFFGHVAGTTLNLDSGATFDYGMLTLENIAFAKLAGATSPAVILANSVLVLRAGANIQSADGTAWGNGAAGEVNAFAIFDENSTVGDGTNPVFSGPTTMNVNIIGGSFVGANALASSTIVQNKSDDSTLAFPQPAGFAWTGNADRNFVYQPGGTAGPSTYITGEGLRLAINATPPGTAKWITCDGTHAALHLTTGQWNLDQCTFSLVVTAPNFTLICDQGASIHNTSYLRFTGGLVVQNQSTVSPFIDTNNGSGFALIYCDGLGTQIESAAAPAVAWGLATVVQGITIFCGPTTNLGDGTHNAFTATAPGSIIVGALEGACNVNAHCFGGTGTVSVNHGPEATVQSVQDVTTFNQTWTMGTNKVRVKSAPAAAVAVNIDTGNITRKRGGNILVTAQVTWANAPAGTDVVSVSLRKDGATLAAAQTVFVTTDIATTGNWGATLVDTDVLADFNTHTYGVNITSGDGATANTVAAVVNAVELA